MFFPQQRPLESIKSIIGCVYLIIFRKHYTNCFPIKYKTNVVILPLIDTEKIQNLIIQTKYSTVTFPHGGDGQGQGFWSIWCALRSGSIGSDTQRWLCNVYCLNNVLKAKGLTNPRGRLPFQLTSSEVNFFAYGRLIHVDILYQTKIKSHKKVCNRQKKQDQATSLGGADVQQFCKLPSKGWIRIGKVWKIRSHCFFEFYKGETNG